MNRFLVFTLCLLSLNGKSWATAPQLTATEELGRQLFLDSQLSSPPGQACASCHTPSAAFADPDKSKPTSKGVISGRFGNRNSPTAMYAAFSPPFHFDNEEGLFLGGQFLDGRASSLEIQAQGPFLNPLEMANPDKTTVVEKVRNATYAPLFLEVFGLNAFDNVDQAYESIATAIASFERTKAFSPFSSKFDAYLAGKATLTPTEQRGLELFENANKGNCAACHPNRPSTDGTPPLFTDFSYDNLGTPRNPDNPFYSLPTEFNPDGLNFIDIGLGKTVNSSAENGKFKVPTLRNIAKTDAFMHNGYFKTLHGVVDFYNTRDTKPSCLSDMVSESQALQQACWPAAEVVENVNGDELGNLQLSSSEVDDIVAFMQILSDGYGDIDQDGDVDNSDLNLIMSAKNKPSSGTSDARDLNSDGKIDLLDARKLVLLCTRPKCVIQ